MKGKHQRREILIIASILMLSFLSGSTYAKETTYNLSAIMKKEVDLGNDSKLDMFIRSSVSLVIPETVKAGENATWEFVLNPASIMIFLEIPSINKTYVTETEVPLEDSKPITIFEGITLLFNFSPSIDLSVTGPASLNQTNFAWENFLDKQTFETQVFHNASGKEKLTINADFYLDTQVSMYVQLQNYTSEIVNFPIPQLEMSPRISDSIGVESKTTTDQIMNFFTNPLFLFIVAFVTFLAVILVLKIIRPKMKINPKIDKINTIQQSESQQITEPRKHLDKSGSKEYCIFCGEKVPAVAIYCRKCGNKIK